LIDFVLTVLAMSLFCQGIDILFQNGMLLNPVRKWGERQKFQLILKPLFLCHECFASTYGSVAFLLLNDVSILWPVACVCCIPVNAIIFRIVN